MDSNSLDIAIQVIAQLTPWINLLAVYRGGGGGGGGGSGVSLNGLQSSVGDRRSQ